MALLMVAQPALAGGGDGGASGNGANPGGAGGPSNNTGAGGNGTPGSDSGNAGISGGGGGGAGETQGTGGNGFGDGGGAGTDLNGANGSSGGGGGGGAHGFVGATVTGSPTGGEGGNGGNGIGGGDANGGGGGGAGGYGAVYTGTSGSIGGSSVLTGGAGGPGGAGAAGTNTDAGGGSGGDGGIGLVATQSGDLSIAGTVTAGRGGNGGAAPSTSTADGGNGGAGGAGFFTDQAVTLTVSGTVIGGNGGDGGGGSSGGTSGDGGAGGAGLSFGSSATVTVTGTVTGGTGANRGTPVSGGSAGAYGAGGVGITGENLDLTVSGTVSGGVDGRNTTRANAIEFTGGTNRLTLEAGYGIFDNVAADGTSDTLELGGASDASFTVSRIGPASQFQGFEAFEKTGTSTWTLTGTTTETTPWTVTGGVLAISDGSALGNSAGTLTLNGGGLSVTASTTVTNPVAIDSANGSIDVATGMSASVLGAVSGTGTLTKSGPGLMSLAADSSAFAGSTNVSAGVLEVNNGLGGDIAVVGELRLIQNATRTFSGVFSGTGTISKQGSGTTTLSGDSSGFAGSTSVAAGELTIPGALGGDIAIATAGTLRLDQATARTFSGALTGDGVLNKQGFGTTTLSGDASGFTGPTNVLSGSLRVTNAFGGNVNIGSIGTFELAQSADRTFGGAIVGAGALTKTGAGASTLTGSSTSFSGTTTVSGGSLLVNGTLGARSSSVQVASGGTLGGTGTVGGDATVQSGGTLSPGASPGTLTVNGNLTLEAGSTSVFELNAPDVSGDASNDFVSVGGDLTLGGALQADVGSVGYYYLFSYGGSLSGAFDDLNVTGVTGSESAIDTDRAGEVNLTVIASGGGGSGGGGGGSGGGGGGGQSMGFWDGSNTTANGVVDGGTGTWDGTTTNWTSSNGSENGVWGQSVGVFMGAAGTVTVEGTQVFDTLQFKTDNYRLTGGALALSPASGSAGTVNVDGGVTTTIASTISDGTGTQLSKVGPGTLVLSGANTYTGGTQVGAGTLQVASDAALGAAAGDLSLTGGTLSTTSTFASARAVSLTATTGGFAPAPGTTLTLAGPVTGSGTLGMSGAGTLTLTGTNSYAGGTQVASGTLIGTTSSIRGNIQNAGTVEFAQTTNGSFAGTIGGLSGTKGKMVKSGAGTLTLTGTSCLPWSILAGSVVSTTELFTGDVMVAAGTSLTFDQAFDGSYGGAVTGTGDILYTGGGRVSLAGDNSGYQGETTVQNFTMTLGGTTLGGNLMLGAGGRLAGTGTVGTTTVQSGGTIAPGNSPGTITVAGDLTFMAGSTYEVETVPGSSVSDLIQVTGTATLAGRVLHIGADGAYPGQSAYTILTADGGISGSFDGVSSTLAFLDPTLGYTPTAVTLNLVRNDVAFLAVGETANQRAAATGIESLGAGNAVYDAVVALDAPTARAAFDDLSGEIHASLKTGLVEDSRIVRDAAMARIQQAFASVGNPVCPEVNGAVVPLSDVERSNLARRGCFGPAASGFSAWGEGFSSWGSSDGTGNAARLDRNTAGFLVGGDAAIGGFGRAGFLAGYQSSDYDADARSSSADATLYHLGAYGGTAWRGLNLRGGAAYSWADIDTARTAAFPGFSESLTGSTNAGTAQVFGEAGYEVLTDPLALEPFAGLAYVAASTDGSAETGGSAALSVQSDTTEVTYTTLGVRVGADLPVGFARARVTGLVGWRHAFGSLDPVATNAFAGGDLFTVAGVPIAEDVAVLGAGLEVDLGAAPNLGIAGATLGVDYDGQFGSGAIDNSVTGRVTVRF